MPDAVYVAEVRMQGPRCVELAIRDADIQKAGASGIHALGYVSETAYNTLTTEYLGKTGVICGPTKEYVVLRPPMPSAFLDRDAVNNYWDPSDIPAGYTLDFGAATCTHITRQSTHIHDLVEQDDSAQVLSWPQYEHWLRFHLDIDLPADTEISISPPAAEFPDVTYTFDDTDTFTPIIKVNNYGFSPFDKKKQAIISGWLPGFGTEGIVDLLALGVTHGYIIRDDTKAIVSRAYPITLRMAANDLSLYNDTRISTTRYFAITAVSKAASMVITAPGHDLIIGDVVAVQYALGMNQINFYDASDYWTITNVSGDDLTFAINSTSFGTYTGGGYIYPRVPCNRSGTNVYEMDFSNWTAPQIGIQYRVHIPGVGVSRPFYVDAAAHYQLAKTAFGGLRNVINGTAKTMAESSYDSPQNLHPDVGGFTMWETQMPIQYTTNGGGAYGPEVMLESPWKGDAVEGVFGGVQDAGDWDVRDRDRFVHDILDMYDVLSAETFAVGLGLVGIASMPMNDDGFWDDLADAPHLVQMAAILLDFMRRTRAAAGECRPGYELPGVIVGTGTSYLPMSHGTLYAYDGEATFAFAAGAAHLSWVLDDLGYATLAATLLALAEESFDRGEEILADPDTFFANLIAIDDPLYQANKAEMVNATMRNLAAVYLHRATLTSEYLTFAELVVTAGSGNIAVAKATFHYEKTVDVNKGLSFSAALVNTADTALSRLNGNDYPNVNIGAALYGSATPPWGDIDLVRGYAMNGDIEYVKALNQTVGHSLGANTQNLSFFTGLTPYQLIGELTVDTLLANAPPIPGITSFIYMRPSEWGYQFWLQGNGDTGNFYASLYTYLNSITAPNNVKQPQPIMYQQPLWQFCVNWPRMVVLMEHAPYGSIHMLQDALVLYEAAGKGQTAIGARKRILATA
jgi:hypothetical protein